MDDDHAAARKAAVTAIQPIPLICTICPKTSKFSDVSHLLTHIASKGHLSNMFKLDIAKVADHDAQRRLDEYQAWFDRHNIRGLLQDRSENRIQKSNGGRGRSATRGGSQSLSLRGGGHASMVSRNKKGKAAVKRDNRRLVDSSIPSTYARATSYNPQDDLDPVSDFAGLQHVHAQQPWEAAHGTQQWTTHLPPWNGAYFEHDFQQDLDLIDVDLPLPDADEGNNDIEVSSVYEPSEAEAEDDDDEINSSIPQSEDTMNTTVLEDDAPAAPQLRDDDATEQKHFRKYLKGDISKLEGVGGFDAAPEDQRKRRNQKKDPSVLVHMEASSRAVRTVEQVTDLNFNHVRWRDVYDEPSIAGSDDEDEESKPPKKAKRSPAAKPRRNTARAARASKIKVEETTSRESSVAPATRVTRRMTRQRGRARQPRQPAKVSTVHATSPEPVELPENSSVNSLAAQDSAPSTTSNGTSVSSYPPLQDDGLPREDDDQMRCDALTYDVYRAGMPSGNIDSQPVKESADYFVPHRRQRDGLSRLALRSLNTNVNVPLLSPTPVFKRHGPARLFSGKENEHGTFSGDSPAVFNPYMPSSDTFGEGSFNPLRVQNQDNPTIRGYPWDDSSRSLAAGFQPISNSGFNSLNVGAQDPALYRAPTYQNGGEYGI
ncbi:hypothetical protein PFICI_01016 [Pestalotiopsis fici W106-1]|uniref:Uncharacterized protein n=1 Tax=Pestalotiopsis fici (strain W106-1 / CGMCC3.15140) TaxID=1229662 RepID=W3XMC0_PESFW|nr:uncharacterized protein PFICI_01016 [Pestalotiopsis fici W106-1]ETS87188.1 hypothetical protein PFICI_01016 [Pestalotiopsis fici W106-1]